jgi:hypothetical protein
MLLHAPCSMLSPNDTPASTPPLPNAVQCTKTQYQQKLIQNLFFLLLSPHLTSTFFSTSRKTTIFPPSVLSPPVIPPTSVRSSLHPFSSVPTLAFPRCCGSLLRLFLRHPILPSTPPHPILHKTNLHLTTLQLRYEHRYFSVGLSDLLRSPNMCIWLLEPPRHFFDRMLIRRSQRK